MIYFTLLEWNQSFKQALRTEHGSATSRPLGNYDRPTNQQMTIRAHSEITLSSESRLANRNGRKNKVICRNG